MANAQQHPLVADFEQSTYGQWRASGAAFGAPLAELGISPTSDVLIGDVTEDGLRDLVFINTSGVHQVWADSGGTYALRGEQIIDIGAAAGVIAPLGDADDGDPGGADLAIGSAPDLGIGLFHCSHIA